MVAPGVRNNLPGKMGGWFESGRDLALLVGGPEGLAESCRATRRWPLVAVSSHLAASTGAGGDF